MRMIQYELIVFYPSLFDNRLSNQFQFKLLRMMMKMDPYCGEFQISLATSNPYFWSKILPWSEYRFLHHILGSCLQTRRINTNSWNHKPNISMVVRRLSYFWIILPEKGCLRSSLLIPWERAKHLLRGQEQRTAYGTASARNFRTVNRQKIHSKFAHYAEWESTNTTKRSMWFVIRTEYTYISTSTRFCCRNTPC